MEFWDIYDENKQRTGRTMKRNEAVYRPERILPMLLPEKC